MASLWTEDLGGNRFKIRWRELVPGPKGEPVRGEDGRLKRRLRSLTVEGKATRDEAVARIHRALIEQGEFQPPTAAEAPRVANLEVASTAWLDWKKTRCKERSVVTYANHMDQFFSLVRELRGIAKDRPVLSTALTRDLLIECIRTWQGRGYSEAWVYSCGRSVIDMWRWASDDPDTFPGVPVPPREAKRVLPRVPIYVAPTAPTLAELDACLRHISPDAEESRRIGSFLRFTGLRISQALGVQVSHIDLDAGNLRVVVGKSRHEEAAQRVVPISWHLLADIRRWVAGRKPDDYLFPAWGAQVAKPAAVRAEAFSDAWKEATERGEVRQEVWAPSDKRRRISRPQHAFRAGFQAFLQSKAVAEEVIDELVGHNGRSVRARHYAGGETLLDRTRQAVDLLPPIDWLGPEDVSSGKVVPFVALRGRAGNPPKPRGKATSAG